jgi:hypothetical protein
MAAAEMKASSSSGSNRRRWEKHRQGNRASFRIAIAKTLGFLQAFLLLGAAVGDGGYSGA